MNKELIDEVVDVIEEFAERPNTLTYSNINIKAKAIVDNCNKVFLERAIERIVNEPFGLVHNSGKINRRTVIEALQEEFKHDTI